MLRKVEPIDVPENEPFQNDKLKRSDCTGNLTRLVDSVTQPFVLCINGSWGSGKTTFIKMWKQQLENQGHICFEFNAWENDYVEDPLIAFIGEMEQQIQSQGSGMTPSDKPTFDRVKEAGKKVLQVLAPAAVSAATHGWVPVTAIQEVVKVLGSTGDADDDSAGPVYGERLERYSEQKKTICDFRKSLEEYVHSLGNADEEGTPPVVFLVDELDRCRPPFAVALLEQLKHLFSVPGIVYVLAMDKDQIAKSIQTLYGADMNADGYLRRFVDLTFTLPDPNFEEYSRFLWEQFGLDDLMMTRSDGREDREALLALFAGLARVFNFSLRIVEQCFTEFNLVARITHRRYRLFPEALAALVSVRAGNRPLYDAYAAGASGANDVLEAIRSGPNGYALLTTNPGCEMEYQLTRWSQKPGELENAVAAWDKTLKNPDATDREQQNAKHLHWRYRNDEFDGGNGGLDYLLGKIELTAQFQELDDA